MYPVAAVPSGLNEGNQERSTLVVVILLAVKLVGTLGGIKSVESVVVCVTVLLNPELGVGA